MDNISPFGAKRPTASGAASTPEVLPDAAAKRRLHRKGVLLVLASAAAFSAKSVFVKLAYRHGVDAITLLSLRMAFSAPMFAAAIAWRAARDGGVRLESRDVASLAGLGVLGYYLSSLFDFLGLQYVSAGLERLILFSYPTIVVVLSAIWLRHRITRREIFALAVTYAGIALSYVQDFTTQQRGVAVGSLLVFASALVYSIYLIASGPLIRRLGSVRFSSWAFLVSTIATLGQFAATREIAGLVQPWPVYGWTMLMAVVSTFLPILGLSEGIRLIGSGRAAMVGSIGPVVTILLAFVFLGEPIAWVQTLGALLVLVGVLSISVAK